MNPHKITDAEYAAALIAGVDAGRPLRAKEPSTGKFDDEIAHRGVACRP